MSLESPFELIRLEPRLLRAAVAVNDTDYSKQADLSAIDVQTAWEKTTGNLNVVVADIDTGIDYTHPDLYANVWINQGEIPPSIAKHLIDVNGNGRIDFYDLNSKKNAKWVKDINGNGVIDAGDLLEPISKGGWEDGIDNDGNGYTDDICGWDFADNDNNPFDYVGHGSHTAGTIAATQDNNFGITGIAQVSLMPVKIFNDDGTGGTEEEIADAIRYSADMGARVSNNSWGYTLTTDGEYSLTYDAEDSATPTYYYPPPGRSGGGSYGDGDDTDDPIYDAIQYAATKGEVFVAAAGNDTVDNDYSFLGSYPASYDLDNIIAVAAVDNSGTLAYFSNFGANTVDIAAPGEDVYSTWLDNGFYTASGTSMATPHVTGTIALMLSRYPKLSIDQLKSDVLSTVNVSSSLADDLVSSGTLDAGAAVHLAAEQRTEAIADAKAATSSVHVAALETPSVQQRDNVTTSIFSNSPIDADSDTSLLDLAWLA